MQSLQPITSVFTGAASCVTLAAQIIDLLTTAKENKAEFKSLLAAVQGIHAFLLELPSDGITSRVLAQLHANLLEAGALLGRVSQMGPLLSLIKAYSIRDQFLRVNRDTVNTFNILAAGEQLLVLAHSRASEAKQLQLQQSQAQQQIQQIQAQLARAQSEFFVQEEAALNRLRDVASAGKHASWPEQLLHRRLLDQLQALPQLSDLAPEQLLAEYRALQMMIMYNGEQPGTAGAGAGGAEGDAASDTADENGLGVGEGGVDNSNKKKGMDEEMEEFLVEQVCAALAATVAASSTGPLTPAEALSPPSHFLCPISSQLMVQPVMLIETGHSYEAAHIQRWLDSHDTCPISRQQLSSKQLVTNITLKKGIESWAEEHGISLPAAPTYVSLHAGWVGGNTASQHAEAHGVSATASRAVDKSHVLAAESPAGSMTAAAPSVTSAAGHRADRALWEPPLFHTDSANRMDQQRQQQLGKWPSKDTGRFVIDRMPDTADLQSLGSKEYRSRKGCTRMRWAIGLVALLLLAAAGAAAGLGVFLSRRAQRGSAAAPGVNPALGINGTSTNSTGPLLNRTIIPYNMQCGGRGEDSVGGWVGCGGPGRECADAEWSGVQCKPGHVCTRDNDPTTPGSGEFWWSCQPEVLDPLPVCGTYTIKQGDTFIQLAKDKGFVLGDLTAVNAGVARQRLEVGQIVNLPCQAAGEQNVFAVALQQHIPLQDLSCEGESFCRLCNKTVADIAISCLNLPKCVAFVIDQQTACGYLKKSATGLRPGGDYVTYCLRSRGAHCAGIFSYYPNTDIKDGGDFSCKQLDSNGRLQSVCFESGTIRRVAGACQLNSDCKAFVTARRDKKEGAFLKNITMPRSAAAKTDLYVKNLNT